MGVAFAHSGDQRTGKAERARCGQWPGGASLAGAPRALSERRQVRGWPCGDAGVPRVRWGRVVRPGKGTRLVGVPGVGSSRGLDKGPAWGSSPEGHAMRHRGQWAASSEWT